MPSKQVLASIVRFVLYSLTAFSVVRRFLPQSVIDYIQSPGGIKEIVETVVGLVTLGWAIYTQISHHTGLEVAAQSAAGTPIEDIKKQTSQISASDKMSVAFGGMPIEEAIAKQEQKNE